MEYVELLRVRRALIVFAVANVFVFVALTFMLHGRGGFHITFSLGKEGASLGDLVVGAAFGALFLATFFGGNLAAETPTMSFLWTKPVSRSALALRYVAIDAAGIVAGVTIGTLMLVALVAGLGEAKYIHLDAGVWHSVALAVGAALAWYGLTLLAASRLDRDGSNVVAALIWPIALLVLMLSIIALPPPGHTAAELLNHVDPLAYLLGSEHRDRGLIAASEWTRAAAVWVIVLSIAGATRLWTTREARRATERDCPEKSFSGGLTYTS